MNVFIDKIGNHLITYWEPRYMDILLKTAALSKSMEMVVSTAMFMKTQRNVYTFDVSLEHLRKNCNTKRETMYNIHLYSYSELHKST